MDSSSKRVKKYAHGIRKDWKITKCLAKRPSMCWTCRPVQVESLSGVCRRPVMLEREGDFLVTFDNLCILFIDFLCVSCCTPRYCRVSNIFGTQHPDMLQGFMSDLSQERHIPVAIQAAGDDPPRELEINHIQAIISRGSWLSFQDSPTFLS
jgi:hypothetical protein